MLKTAPVPVDKAALGEEAAPEEEIMPAPKDEAALVPHAGIGEAMEMLCTRNERVVVAVFHGARKLFKRTQNR